MRWDDEIVVKRPRWRGQQFDSQLEADWAATFTAWGMEYEYHPGRLYLSSGDVWEPDFHVDGDIVFEVKGALNDRIQKAWQASADGYNVIVGRSPWIPAGSDLETAGAVWEPEHWVVANVGSKLLFTQEQREDGSYTAMLAFARGWEGIRMFKAVGEDAIV